MNQQQTYQHAPYPQQQQQAWQHDAQASASPNGTAEVNRPKCQYGTNCRRKNPQHWIDEKHPPICPHHMELEACPDDSSGHRRLYAHPCINDMEAMAQIVAVMAKQKASSPQGAANVQQKKQRSGCCCCCGSSKEEDDPPPPPPPPVLNGTSSSSTVNPMVAVTPPQQQTKAATTNNNVPPPNKEACKYGVNCYNRKPEHRARFWHPDATPMPVPAPQNSSPSTPSSEKKPCRYGAICRDVSAAHRAQYHHPPTCNNHPNCTDMSAPHRAQYSHPCVGTCTANARCQNPDPNHWSVFKHPIHCRYGASCRTKTEDHLNKYSHPPESALVVTNVNASFSLNGSVSGSYGGGSSSDGGPLAVPSYWLNDLSKGEVQRINITGTKQGNDVADTFNRSTSKDNFHGNADTKSLRIHKIERIENFKRWQLYKMTLNNKLDAGCCTTASGLNVKTQSDWMSICKLDSSRGEFYLFHGTDLADVLVEKSFNEKFSNEKGRYGHGTYFGEDPAKCDQYVNPDSSGKMFIFMSRVAMGKPYMTDQFLWPQSLGTNNAMLQAPGPCTPEGLVLGVQDTYDSVIANPKQGANGWFNFREFIIYYGELAYPEFLITYSRVT